MPASISAARRAGVPSSSKAKLPRVPGTVGSDVMLTAGEPYRSDPTSSGRMNERAGVVGLVAEDPVEFQRVPGRLVDLQRHLLRRR